MKRTPHAAPVDKALTVSKRVLTHTLHLLLYVVAHVMPGSRDQRALEKSDRIASALPRISCHVERNCGRKMPEVCGLLAALLDNHLGTVA